MSGARESEKVVRLAAGDCGAGVEIGDYLTGIVGHCADTLAMLASDRVTLPRSTVLATEALIRRQRDAVLSLGEDVGEHVVAWCEGAEDSGDPWKAWVAVFLLASIGGPSLAERLLRALSAVPGEDDDHWSRAAEALALVATSGDVTLGQALLAAPAAAARAAGLDLLSRLGSLSTDALATHLDDTAPAVATAAARAAARAGLGKSLAPELLRCVRGESRVATWEAARALTLAGVPEPYLEIQGGGALAAALGAGAVEILVMAGDDRDVAAFEAMIAGTPMTRGLLSAVARFGDVTTWSFLLHYLADPDLADAALDALHTLFGDMVPVPEATSFQAWKRAIAAADLDPTRRYRDGKLWRPEAVLDEIRAPALSRAEVARRADELAARLGLRARVDVGLWEREVQQGLDGLGREVEAHAARWRPGAWR
jgi:hypothetical protein